MIIKISMQVLESGQFVIICYLNDDVLHCRKVGNDSPVCVPCFSLGSPNQGKHVAL